MTDVVLTTGLDTRQAARDIDQLVALAKQKFGSIAKMAAAVQGSGSTVTRAAQAQASALEKANLQLETMTRRVRNAQAELRKFGDTSGRVGALSNSLNALNRSLEKGGAGSKAFSSQLVRTQTAVVKASAALDVLKRNQAAQVQSEAAAQAAAQSTIAAFNRKVAATQKLIDASRRAASEEAKAAQASEAAFVKAFNAKTAEIQRYVTAHRRAADAAAKAQARADAAMAKSQARAAAVAQRALDREAKERARAAQKAIADEARKEAAVRKAAAAQVAAAERVRIAEERVAVARAKALAAADNRALNLRLRIDRQLAGNTELQESLTNRLNAAMIAHKAAIAAAVPGTLAFVAAQASLQQSFTAISGSIAKTGGLLPTITAGFGRVTGALGILSSVVLNTQVALAGLTAILGFREFVAATEKLDAYRFTLQAASEDSNDFAVNQDFLRQKADEIGFGYADVGRAFARFSLAVVNAGHSSDDARGMFEKLAGSARNLNLSTADVTGVIRALEQSFSKGKFMAEEVRLQLGDRLPFAMQALKAAVESVDGAGADLNDMFEKGTITTEKYAGAFIDKLFEMSGGTRQLETTSKGLQATIGHLSSAWSDFVTAAGDAGVYDAIIAGVKGVTAALKGAADAARGIADALRAPAIATDATTMRGIEESTLNARNELYLLEIQLSNVKREKNRGPLVRMREELLDLIDTLESRNPKLLLQGINEQLEGYYSIIQTQPKDLAAGTQATIDILEAEKKRLEEIIAGFDKAKGAADAVKSAAQQAAEARTPDQLDLIPANNSSFSADGMDDLVKEMEKFDDALKQANDEAHILTLASYALAVGYFKTAEAADAWAKKAIAGLKLNKRETKAAETELSKYRKTVDSLLNSFDKFQTRDTLAGMDDISAATKKYSDELEDLQKELRDTRITEQQRAKLLKGITYLENARVKAVRDATIAYDQETDAVKRSAEQLDIETQATLRALDIHASAAETDYERVVALLELEEQTELARIAEERRQLVNQRELADGDALRAINERIAALDKLKDATERSFDAKKAEAFSKRNKDLAEEFHDSWSNTASAIEDLFDDLFGDVGSKLGKFGGLVTGIMTDVLKSVTGSTSNSIGGIIGDVIKMSITGAGGSSASGAAGGGFSFNPLSSLSNIWSLVSGGPTAAATGFATSGIGTALGLSQGTAFSAGVAAVPGGLTNVAAAGTGGMMSLTGAGSALVAAAPYLAVAAMALPVLMSVFGRKPSVGPTGVARLPNVIGSSDIRTGVDNGGDAGPAVDLAKSIRDIATSTATTFGLSGNKAYGLDIGYFPQPEAGNSQPAGFNIKEIIDGVLADSDLYKGLTADEALAQGVRLTLQKAFDNFPIEDVSTALQNSAATTIEELLSDLDLANAIGTFREKGIEAVRELQRPLTEVEQAFKTFEESAAKGKARAEELGLAVEDATAYFDAMRQELVDQTQAGFTSRIRDLTGQGYLNQVQALLDQRANDARDAQAAGLDINDTAGTLFNLGLGALLGGLTADQRAMIGSTFADQQVQDVLTATDLGAANDNNPLAEFAAALSDSIDAIEQQTSAIESQIDEWKKLAESLRQGRIARALNSEISVLDPRARLGVALGEYDRVLAAALSGDQDAANRFNDVADAALKASVDYFGRTNQNTVDLFNRIQADSQRVEDLTVSQIDLLKQQLDELTLIRTSLEAAGGSGSQDFGRNPVRNRILASLTGYTGDFGSGGFGDFMASQNFPPELLTLISQITGSIGFATGGSFTVGGVGGVDANIVPLRLTRGEHVNVSRQDSMGEVANGLAVIAAGLERLTRVVAASGEVTAQQQEEMANELGALAEIARRNAA